MGEKQFPCGQCGAKLTFAPGKASLACSYCSHENVIPQSEADIQELDFHAHLANLEQGADTVEVQTVTCTQCAGQTTLAPDITADRCAFCGADIVATATSKKAIRPASLLPFRVTKTQALEHFRAWVKGLWFAPNALAEFARTDGRLQGVYVPYWTYDANTTTWYSGQRGDAYYETVRRGDNEERVRKIRWSFTSGVVWNQFDDVIVLASKSLPTKYAERLEPWDLENLEPYQDEYLSGFRAESYQVDLEQGFTRAKDIMESHIRRDVCRDIGGDEQRVTSMRTRHEDVTFKHVLLPIWISAYTYGEDVYRFLVNARTGEVQGERPWSWIKITLAVLAAIAVIAAVIFVMNK